MIHRCPGHPASVVPAPRAPHPGCRPGRRRRRHGRVRGDHGGPAPGAARWALPRWALGGAGRGPGAGAVRCGRCGGGERRVEGRAERWGRGPVRTAGREVGCPAASSPGAVCQATGVSACGLQCAGRQASAPRHQPQGIRASGVSAYGYPCVQAPCARRRATERPGFQAPWGRTSGRGSSRCQVPGVRRPRGQGVRGSRRRGVEASRCWSVRVSRRCGRRPRLCPVCGGPSPPRPAAALRAPPSGTCRARPRRTARCGRPAGRPGGRCPR